MAEVICPGCCLPHDPEPCIREAADCDCCRAIRVEICESGGVLCEFCEVQP